jgi:hypothetical protein
MVNRKYTLLSSTFGTIVVVFLLVSALLSTLLVDSSSSSSAQVTESTSSCMLYNSAEKIITITCKSANLTDIDNQLKDPGILHKETAAADDTGIWLLNAGVEVAQYATLYINSTDTTWLKIVADGKEAAHIIHILGS